MAEWLLARDSKEPRARNRVSALKGLEVDLGRKMLLNSNGGLVIPQSQTGRLLGQITEMHCINYSLAQMSLYRWLMMAAGEF